MITSLGIFLELEIFQTKVVEKIETYYAVYEIMWKNTIKPNRPNIILTYLLHGAESFLRS